MWLLILKEVIGIFSIHLNGNRIGQQQEFLKISLHDTTPEELLVLQVIPIVWFPLLLQNS